MAGCTSVRTPRLAGGARSSRIGLLDHRIALQSCQAGGAQSCPRRRTPQRTPQPARLSGGGARWSTWTNPTLAARTPSLVHVDQPGCRLVRPVQDASGPRRRAPTVTLELGFREQAHGASNSTPGAVLLA